MTAVAMRRTRTPGAPVPSLPHRLGVSLGGTDRGRSGIGTYAREVVRRLAGMSESGSLEVIGSVAEIGALGLDELRGPRLARAFEHPAANILWHQYALPRVARAHSYDVLFLPAGNRRLPGRVDTPSVGTVHDWSSLHVAGKYDIARSFYIERVLPGLVRKLTRVITVSQSSKRDIVEHAQVDPARVVVIPNGVDLNLYRPGPRDEARRELARGLGVIGPYLLYVSRIEHPGKNHVRLLRAFERFKLETGLPHRLVLAGPDWNRADHVHREIARSRYRDAVVTTGFVDSALLPALYRGADAVVFPSLYEGFGIPVIEAMACGTPVVCSDRSSLPEVGGDAVHYVNPECPVSLADGMTAVVTEPTVAAALRDKGLERSADFSWDVTAARTAAVLALTAEERS